MKEVLDIIGDFMLNEFRRELEGQDHVATGKLLESLDYEVKQSGDSYEIIFTGVDYAGYLDTGTSAGRYVPIDNLIKWVEAKGIAAGEKEIKNAAYAIQKAIYNEGTPTSGSYKHSKNGRRTDWIQYTAQENSAKINARLVAIISENINVELFNLARNISV